LTLTCFIAVFSFERTPWSARKKAGYRQALFANAQRIFAATGQWVQGAAVHHQEWILMRKLLISTIAAAIGSACWIPAASAELLSATRSVIAILGGDLYVGSAVGHLNGAGTLTVHSQADPAITCAGDFTSTKLGGAGQLHCNDGATATFQFKRVDAFRGHGGGTFSRGTMSFTYGLSVDQSIPHLAFPSGKKLLNQGEMLTLVDM